MEIGPIFRTLLRNKLGVLLIAIQIAFTMTVMINAIFIINERTELVNTPSGMDDANLFHINVIGIGDDYNEQIAIAEDLAMLNAIPGVIAATTINSLPVSGGGSSTGVRLEYDISQPSVGTAIYYGDNHTINTMDLELIAGEGFSELDVPYRDTNGFTNAAKTVISRQLAENLFPERAPGSVIGEYMFLPAGNEIQIVGVVEELVAPWPTSSVFHRSMLVPEIFLDGFSIYLIRTEPGQRDRVTPEVEAALVAANPERVVRALETMDETRADTFRVDSSLMVILWVIIGMLLFITGMGIVGLAVFSINRRRKQIGTRRALGASRLEILRYFMLENFMISTMGVLIGAALTIGLSIFISTAFNMPAMAWYYTPLGMLTLVVLGQLAVFGPSNGAAKTELAIATRSV